MPGKGFEPDAPPEVLSSRQPIKALTSLGVKNKNASLLLSSPIALHLSEFNHMHWVMKIIIIMHFFFVNSVVPDASQPLHLAPSRETKVCSYPGGKTGLGESPLSPKCVYCTL